MEDIIIKKLKKCERIDNNLYTCICQKYQFWVDKKQEDRWDIIYDGFWIWEKDYLFYQSLYINSSCLRTLFNQQINIIRSVEIINEKDKNTKQLFNDCMENSKLIRRWYNLKDQQSSKERKVIQEESQKKKSYLFLLPVDIFKLIKSLI